MSIQFENKYYVSPEMKAEFYLSLAFKNAKKIGIVFFITSFFPFFMAVMQKNYISIIILGVLAFITSILAFFIPFFIEQKMKKKIKNMPINDNIPETIIQFDDNILITENDQLTTVEYSQISKIHRLKHSYVLIHGDIGTMVSLKDFSVGEFEDFKVFLKEKCLNAKYL